MIFYINGFLLTLLFWVVVGFKEHNKGNDIQYEFITMALFSALLFPFFLDCWDIRFIGRA